MTMRKAWVFDSPPLPDEEFDYGSISKTSRGSWMRSHSKGGEEMLYTITAVGELPSEQLDVLHASAAAHTNSIKKKRKKAKNRKSVHQQSDSPEQTIVRMNIEPPATPAKAPVKLIEPTSPASPVIINTVEDLLRILAERGLGSVPPSPAVTTCSDTDTSHSDDSTTLNTPVDSDFEKLVDSGFKLSAELESPEALRKKLNLPADEKTIRNLQSLISYLSVPRKKVCTATTMRRKDHGAVSAVDRARHASLKRFLAYHELREKERSHENDENYKTSDGAAQWVGYRNTVGPIFDGRPTSASAILKESIKLNRPQARVRKPIPTWF